MQHRLRTLAERREKAIRRFTIIASNAFLLLLLAIVLWRLWIGPGWVLTMLIYGWVATSLMAWIAMGWMAAIQKVERDAINRRERRRILNQREITRE